MEVNMVVSKSDDEKKSGDRKKIISVTVSQSLVDRIDELVQERVARSRAQLIEDAVRWYLERTVYKWTERGIYIDSFRIILESETLSSLFFSKLTPTDQYELGRTAGSQAPFADVVRLFHGQDPTNPNTRELVYNLLQENGWGSFSQRDDIIVIASPFYPGPFIQGYLETLLDVELELMGTNVKDNVALKIK
ncbi:MAG: ribbon-helix-helix protein, CopG family [Candidatus Lokiarchaeota archaeon]|nr:ribbon-helix-helix protein, CopG family [Candidatus Lokiarchaeota archaeon]